ncbi:hypothetical protein D9M70_596070 [compost metagenome]
MYDEEDSVSRYDFESSFKKNSNVLEICEIGLPDWMEDILDLEMEDRISIIDLIIDEIKLHWGEIEIDMSEEIVGEVGKTKINRRCTIVTRT